ncbi:MAG: transporter, partial [Pseudomonadota bacterium]
MHASFRPVGLAGIAVMAWLPAVAPAQSDTSPINTERPSFSASPLALSTGALQIEAGYQYTDAGATGDSLPNLLVRYGFAEAWEVQLGWAGRNRVDVGPTTIRGASDTSVAVKYAFSEPGTPTALALLAGVTVPTGNQAFSSDSVDPSVGLLWSHSGALDLFGTVLVNESD